MERRQIVRIFNGIKYSNGNYRFFDWCACWGKDWKGGMMADLIDRLALGNRMYHEAFEKDSDMQKWDSGCWIRYKLFENVLRDTPSVDAVEVVRCKDCVNCEYDSIFNQYWCGGYEVISDGFCNYGERKDD